jgi:hypothetical protein
MDKRDLLIAAAAMFGLCTGGTMAEPSKNFKVFLCFGQSNISGGQGVSPTSDVTTTTPRVMAVAFNDYPGNWKRDSIVPAKEPLHYGDGGTGNSTMGPVYVFGKAMADSLPNDTICVIPCGQSGVNIEHFIPGGKCTQSYCIPWPANSVSSVYQWMLDRCKLAQKRGVIAGIILHQGEANSGQKDWPGKVKTIYDDLKKDLGLSKDIPLVAGELLQASGACCAGHNTVIADIPKTLPFGYVASSKDLVGGGNLAQYHFNQDGYKQMGKRMAVQMMKGLRASGQMTSVSHSSSKNALTLNNLQTTSVTSLHTIDGKKIPGGSIQNLASVKKHCIYIMQTPGKQASLVVNPE